MDAFLLAVAGIVIAVPTAILVMMFFLKGANAHKERMFLEQEQLDKKNGVVPKPDSPENTGAKKKRGSERMIEHLPSFLVIAIGTMFIYWAYHSSLHPADVGSFGYEKWLTLVFITWGVLSALIALNAEKAVAKTLQSVLMWVMLALLIVLPLWSWVVTPSAPVYASQRAVSVETPVVTAPQSIWPTLAIPVGVGVKTELLPVKPDGHLVFKGNNFQIHNVYLDGHECIDGMGCIDGPLKGVYLTTLDPKIPGIASYSYAPM